MVSLLPNTMFSCIAAWWLVATLLSSKVQLAAAEGTRWIQYTGNDGTVWLDDDRKPSLYTETYGDCQGDSLIEVTRFDGAYYKDNMTVLFHLEGNSLLKNDSLMRKLIYPKLRQPG